jgi:hypothetical protein
VEYRDQVAGNLVRWPCLEALIGGPPERNACRSPVVQELNLGGGLTFSGAAGWALDLTFDGVNLLDSGASILDAAIFIADPTQPLTVGPEAYSLRIPVKVNPDFGRPMIRSTAGRSFRVGLSLRHSGL